MRKRLSVATAAMIFACAISPAAVWAEQPATPETATAETAVTAEETPEAAIATLDLTEQDAPAVASLVEDDAENGVATQKMPQNELQQNIDKYLTSTTEGGTLTLGGDQTISDGLSFTGNSGSPASEWKTYTIDANGYKITLEGTGIDASYCNVVIKNCPELVIHAHTTPSDNHYANLFSHATLTLDNCPKVTIENNLPEGQGGSGLCVYNEGSLYFQNNTNVTISGYMAKDCSGIYMDRNDKNYDEVMGEIKVTGNSSLTATKCYHNGITANPVNITVTGSSTIKTCDNNTDESDGEGGLGCYFGKLTVADNSSVVSTGNTAWGFGIFVQDLDVDGTSEIVASNNGSFYHYGEPWNFDNWDGTGLAISGTAVLHSGAKVTANDNWGVGVRVYRDVDSGYMGGTLTVESGATLSSIHNANYGLANAYNLNINSGAHVYLRENYDGGLDNYPLATTTVDAGADFVVSNNCGRGIKNGNSGKDHIGEPATLILNSGVITENYNTKQMPAFPFLDAKGYGHYVDDGGGIYNEYGSVSLSSAAKVYNNHAENSGDDLFNSDVEGNNFTITQLVPGAKWSILDDDQKIIDYWYKDDAGKDNRWKADRAIGNETTTLPRGAALKAAHGAVAPTPSPSPTPDPTATPTPTAAPTNEPSPVPSASPVPSTPVPSAVPTAAPTEAPVQPTTAPVAPVTRVNATATPAPTDAPTQQPTTAPAATAQPATTATIPQTGDAAPLALLGGLTVSSAAAFYFLRKRRKSE